MPLVALGSFLSVVVLLLALLVGAARLGRRSGAAWPPGLVTAEQASRRALGRATLGGAAAALAVGLGGWVVDRALPAPAEPWADHPATDLGMLLAPTVMGAVGLLILLIEMRRTPTVTTPRRSASVARRRVRDYVPTAPLLLVATALLLLLALLVIGVLTADANGRTMTINAVLLDGGGALTKAYRPWPGWFYAVPIAVLVLIQLGLGARTMQDAAGRPQVTTGDDDGLDAVLRRRAVHGALGFLLVSLSLPLLVLAFSTMGPFGDALGEHPIAPPSMIWTGVIGMASIVLALVCLAVGVALLTRRPALGLLRDGPATTRPLATARATEGVRPA